jgi:hypothetical protein
MSTAEANLKKLRKTVIPINFVKKNNGAWNHEQWLEFCEMLKEKGYTPINFDQVGLLLEKKKADYLAKKSS